MSIRISVEEDVEGNTVFVLLDSEGYPIDYAKFNDEDDAKYCQNLIENNELLQGTDVGHNVCNSMASVTYEEIIK